MGAWIKGMKGRFILLCLFHLFYIVLGHVCLEMITGNDLGVRYN